MASSTASTSMASGSGSGSGSGPTTSSTPTWVPAKSLTHFIAGGLGGMCGAIVTSPFDVVKTRLQSSLFNHQHSGVAYVQVGGGGGGGSASATLLAPARRVGTGGLLYNFVETGHILKDIYNHESPRALFKGLGPTLVGAIPARSINFYTYGNGKQIIASTFNDGKENSWVHLAAAAVAGVVTGTATNPIWVVKTRLQLTAGGGNDLKTNPNSKRIAQGSWTVIKQILREEGVRGFYKGLSASYLGVTEGTIQWVLYERLKRFSVSSDDGIGGGNGEIAGFRQWLGMLASAGTAKCVASLITYPHEVIRTRLRQPLVDGQVKYTGLLQTFRVVVAEEGSRALYGGLSAHLMRVVPNAAVMYAIYEGVLSWTRER